MRGSLTIISRISEATDCVLQEENKIGLANHCSFIFSLGILLSRAAWWVEVTETQTSCYCKKAKQVFDGGRGCYLRKKSTEGGLPLVRAVIEGVRLWVDGGMWRGPFSSPSSEVYVLVNYLAK